jgi:hypothetical protein
VAGSIYGGPGPGASGAEFGLNKESDSTPTTKQPNQLGQQCSIRGPKDRAGHLAAEDRNLVAEHDDLDRQLVAVMPTQAEQLKDSDEGEVEERQGHGPVSLFTAIPGKSYSGCPDDILGTHRLLGFGPGPG